jgi:hypothetical protein
MPKVYEAVLKPASSGFAMWQVGKWSEVEGAESIREWELRANDNGINLREAGELNGMIYDQSGGTPYAGQFTNPETGDPYNDEESFWIVREDKP